MMQDVVGPTTSVLMWVVLLLGCIVVALLAVSLRYLHPQQRRRALMGVLAMALVLLSAATSQLLLAAHHAPGRLLLSQLLLPLVASLLLLSLYRLSFPRGDASPTPRLFHLRRLLLLALTVGVFILASSLVLLDLLPP